MFIKIVFILYFFFTLCSCDDSKDGKVIKHLDLPEGADCEWDGVKGKCVKETQCLTTLDKRGDPHPICSTKGDDKIVCCTDCELINSTRNIVFGARGGYYCKNGAKSRDSCLEYLNTLPYRCRDGGYYSGISKEYLKKEKCHIVGFWAYGGSPPPNDTPGIKYPHQALLGYGNDVESAKWEASGTIISNKYILTVAHIGKLSFQGISFNENVLPACLPFETNNDDDDDDKAIYTTWIQLESAYTADLGVRAQTVTVDKFSEDECKDAYSPFKTQFSEGIDYNKQICYGTKEKPRIACKGNSGEPLLMLNKFAKCIHMVIGVTSFGRSQCGNKQNYPDVYSRVAYYKPWIESVVWP